MVITPGMILRFICISLGLVLAGTFGALAEDCKPGTNAVGGTLASPTPPCPPPAPKARAEPPAARANKETADKGAQPAGTYRDGNTTIHIGGSIQTGTTIRGR